MAAPVSADEFLDLLRKSGVADDRKLDAYLQKQRASGLLPNEASKLAGVLVRDGLLTLFQADQIMQGKWRRFTIGKYKVLEKLGSGGMGSVFLCEHKFMRRRVAVKVLPTAKAEDPASLDRFYREARAVAALDHPNIVHAYDIDQDEKLHFLVMEYVDGSSLQEIVKKSGPLDVLRACHYIRQAADGLQHAHEAGLVHRDIKPGNIIVDRNGTVKVLDMGLARFFNDEDDILTKKYDENVLGTADYLAPEQAIDSHAVDIRADIYALGATFYFMLAGRPPFNEGTVAQKLLWHQTRNPKPITEWRDDVPGELAAIIGRMMAKDAAQRYAVPAEVERALAPFTQTPIGPPPEAEMPHLSPAIAGTSTGEGDTAVVRSSGGSTLMPRSTGSSAERRAVAPPSARNSSATATLAPNTTPPQLVSVPRPPNPPATAASKQGVVTATPAPMSMAKAAVAAPPSPRPAPAPLEESPLPWQQPVPMMEEAAALDMPDPAVSIRLPGSQSKSEKRERLRWRVVTAAVGIPFLVLVAGLLYWYFPRNVLAPTPGRPRLVVTSDPAVAHGFRTIAQALRQAQPGDVIELRDARHEENLDVGKGLSSVTLQAASGAEVQWLPRTTDKPLLRLVGATGFTFKGKGITLDGKGELRDLVDISLHAPGVTLDDLTLVGYKRTAIAITNAEGEPSRPIALLNLRVPGADAKKPAVRFDAIANVYPPVDGYIRIDGLNVEGGKLSDAVQATDTSVLGPAVTWPGREASK